MEAIEKLQMIALELKEMAIEREQEVDMALIAILSGSHMVMLGSPGVAKSMLIRNICERIEEGKYFEHLLSKYTTDKDLFVAQTNIVEQSTESGKSIKFIPDTTGMLPEAHIAFLDETFKANSATLNSLLTLVNEKKFHVQGKPISCPLISLFGASNELPDEEDGLGALYDRFLIRIISQRVKDRGNRIEMRQKSRARRGNKAAGNLQPTTITLTELADLQKQVLQVVVPVSIDEQVEELVEQLLSENIIISDRRDVRVDPLLQAKALMEGRKIVNVTDLSILRHCFWSDPKEIKTVERIILSVSNPMENEAMELLDQAEEIRVNALKAIGDQAGAAGAEANTKLKKLSAEMSQLIESAKTQGVDATKIIEAQKRIQNFNKEVVKTCLGIDI
ncbi:MAG: AAA family ATPase [Patescibacteria group bacterium]